MPVFITPFRFAFIIQFFNITYYSPKATEKSLQDLVAANSKAVDLSLRLYTEGLLEFLNVLVAQNSLYAAENALVQSSSNISTDLIALYKALGGGWEQAPPTAALKAEVAEKTP
jgi:outer membrane protein, multidrug efflux system